MNDSTLNGKVRKAQGDKPKLPYPEFPLRPHGGGKWKRKIAGRTFYFGRWGNRVDGKLVRIKGDGWKKALAEY